MMLIKKLLSLVFFCENSFKSSLMMTLANSKSLRVTKISPSFLTDTKHSVFSGIKISGFLIL